MENNNSAYKSRMLTAQLSFEPGLRSLLLRLADERPFVFRHSIDVAYLAGEIAFELELEYAADVIRGALLHDIGKLGVPSDMLLTSAPLTESDKAVLRSHSDVGYAMIESSERLSDLVKDVVRYHHEKQDGTGYPFGLRSSELGKAVKIVTVCDIYDAMTRERPYGRRYGAYEALSVMASEPIDKSLFQVLKERVPDR